MAKKFISVLGVGTKGVYENCIYTWEEEKSFETEYIQEAIANIFCDNWNESDKVIILTTDKSKELHWDKDNTLKDRLSKKKFQLENRMIPFGGTPDEQWRLFEIIFNSLDQYDEVIVDITHSFRTIPMFLMIILNYAKLLKNIKVHGIYYGAYENGYIGECGLRIAPIYDLTLYDLIMDFTNGINTFINTGNSNVLMKIYNELNIEKDKVDKYKHLNETISALNDFSNSIMTCRGNISFLNKENGSKKSILAAHNQFKEKIEEYKRCEDDNLSMTLTPLFEKVSKETEEFEGEDPVKIGISTVRWCIKNGLVQQGITALEETMKVLVCMKFGLDYKKQSDRDMAKNILNVSNIPYEKWRLKHKEKEFVSKIVLTNKLPDNIIELSKKLSKLRNDINHFGLNMTALESEKIKKRLKIYFEEFVKQVEIITWKKY